MALTFYPLITHSSFLNNRCDTTKITAVAILAESPGLESFNSARQVAAYAGPTPKHRTSGTSVRGKTSISKDA